MAKKAPEGAKLRNGVTGAAIGGLFGGVAGGLAGVGANALKKGGNKIEVLNLDQVPEHYLEAIHRMGGLGTKLKHANVSLDAFYDELAKIG